MKLMIQIKIVLEIIIISIFILFSHFLQSHPFTIAEWQNLENSDLKLNNDEEKTNLVNVKTMAKYNNNKFISFYV
jgi:hypothetical protein